MCDKLRAAHDKLQQAVAEIASGDDWKGMLWNPPAVGTLGCDLGGLPRWEWMTAGWFESGLRKHETFPA